MVAPAIDHPFQPGYRLMTGTDLTQLVEAINAAFAQTIGAGSIGQPNGVATLDAQGHVPASEFPAPATFGAVDLTTAQTIAAVKTFSSSPIVPAPSSGTDASNKNYVDAQITIINQSKVDLTTDQTVAGVKTFSSSPVVPATPTTANQAAPKTYVDTGDDRVPTNTVRGGVLEQAAIANIAAAPTQADFNGLLAALRSAGILAP